MFKKLLTPALAIAGAALLAGCAENTFGGSSLTTASVTETPRTDAACITLASQIESLKKEGVADKVAQASVKKYKMSTADLAKADQLNRTNTEFQAKCSMVKPGAGAQTAAAAPTSAAIAPAVAKTAAE